MRNPEDIMAGYLLKGGKMLEKACPECGSPLFTVKGETFCVVCRETGAKQTPAPLNSAVKDVEMSQLSAKSLKSHTECPAGDAIYEELGSAIISLCGRIKNENRPEDCLVLMESVSVGIDALKKL